MRLSRSLRQCCFVWLLAAMAMLGQIVGAAAMPDMAEDSPLGIICSVDNVAGNPAAPGHPARHHHHDCAVCPLCAAAALHAALLSPPPLFSPPLAVVVAAPASHPPARAPPSWQFEQPFPRGPPAFA